MKKIISIFALASLGLGIASADVKFSINYRTQMAAASRIMGYGAKTATTASVKFAGTEDKTHSIKDEAYTTYLLNQLVYGGDSDTFSMSASNDFGGVTVRIDPKGSNSSFTLNQYSGYVKLGPLTVTAGYWKDGVMNGNYQLKTDSDAYFLGGETFAAYKLGSLFKKAITVQVDDIASFSGTAGNTGYITYAGDLGDVKIKADLSAIGLGTSSYNDEGDVKSGFALRLDTKFESWDTQFVFKQASIKSNASERALALHVQPLAWGALKATFGGSLGFYNGELTEYNADIRFRFVAGSLSITSLNNISRISNYGKDKKGVKEYVKSVGLIANIGADGLASFNNDVSQSAMWNVLAFRLAASESLALTLEVGDIVGFKSAGKRFGDYGIEAFAAPGLQVYAGKNCAISSCARIGVSHLALDSDSHEDEGPDYGILVPVVIRVRL